MTDDFNDFIAEVKERADIVTLIGRYVRLKKQGARFVGVCPFHNDHKPSMNVTPQMGIYKCFVCGAGGDIIEFVKEFEKVSFREALKIVAEQAGIAIPAHFARPSKGNKGEKTERILAANAAAAQFFQLELKKSSEVRQYLEIRGVSPDTQGQYQLGLAPGAWDGLLKYARKRGLDEETLILAGLATKSESGRVYDRFRNRLMFPIWNFSNRIVAFGGRTLEKDQKIKYINSPETPLYQKSRILYGFNFSRSAVSQSGDIILVEGYMDVLSLRQAGFLNVAAVSGTALTENHAAQIARFARRVFFFLDGDAAGVSAIRRSLPALLQAGLEVRVPYLPANMDPDSLVREKGKAAAQTALDKSRNIVQFLVQAYSDNKKAFSPEAKNNLYQESRAVLDNIQTTLIKGEYLDMLHQMLDIPSPPAFNVPLASRRRHGPSGAVPVFRPRLVYLQLLQLVLFSRETLYEAMEKLELEWIEDPFVRDLVDRIFAYAEDNHEFKLPKLLDFLPEKQKYAVESVEPLDSVDLHSIKKQFNEIVITLERRYIQKRMKELSFQIRNNRAGLAREKESFFVLHKRLKYLNNSGPGAYPGEGRPQ